MNSINRIAYSNRKIDKTMHLFWSKNMTNWAQYDNHWLSRPGWNVINVILSMVWWSNRVISLYLYIDENWIKNYHFQKNSQRIEDLASYSSFFFDFMNGSFKWFTYWNYQMSVWCCLPSQRFWCLISIKIQNLDKLSNQQSCSIGVNNNGIHRSHYQLWIVSTLSIHLFYAFNVNICACGWCISWVLG